MNLNRKALHNILLLILPFIGYTQDVALMKYPVRTDNLAKHKILNIQKYSPSYFHVNPIELAYYWGDEVIATNKYDAEAIKFQKTINDELGNFVKTYAPINQLKSSQINNYNLPIEERNIDDEPITPYTWKKVKFEILGEDGSQSEVHLLRPNWWIKQQGIKEEGDHIYL
jgi:GH25 family lysozyme M1 (1,4-beta-N-acetylmuramidase)